MLRGGCYHLTQPTASKAPHRPRSAASGGSVDGARDSRRAGATPGAGLEDRERTDAVAPSGSRPASEAFRTPLFEGVVVEVSPGSASPRSPLGPLVALRHHRVHVPLSRPARPP